jgi:hypothetical protein
MSSNIDEHANYLRLLLNTEPNQQRSLLSTSTPEQLDVLSEIFHNFLILPLSREEREFIRPRAHVIKKIGDISKSARFRRSAIKKHYRQILNTLIFFKDKLISVIN